MFTTHLASPSPNTNFFGGNVSFADLDADGILDVLVSDVDTDIPGCGRQLVVLQGQGLLPNVTYSDPLGGASRPWTPEGTHDVAALHIDNELGKLRSLAAQRHENARVAREAAHRAALAADDAEAAARLVERAMVGMRSALELANRGDTSGATRRLEEALAALAANR